MVHRIHGHAVHATRNIFFRFQVNSAILNLNIITTNSTEVKYWNDIHFAHRCRHRHHRRCLGFRDRIAHSQLIFGRYSMRYWTWFASVFYAALNTCTHKCKEIHSAHSIRELYRYVCIGKRQNSTSTAGISNRPCWRRECCCKPVCARDAHLTHLCIKTTKKTSEYRNSTPKPQFGRQCETKSQRSWTILFDCVCVANRNT